MRSVARLLLLILTLEPCLTLAQVIPHGPTTGQYTRLGHPAQAGQPVTLIHSLTHTASVLEAASLLGNIQGDSTLYGAQIHANIGSPDRAKPLTVQGDWLDIGAVDHAETPRLKRR
jgi:hypothetical protein